MPPQNRTPTDLNYAVLSRYLPRLNQILTTASYAHIYLWSSTSQSWSKANFEGSIFIVSLTPPTPSQPEDYLLFLLNRSGLDNFSYALREPAYIDPDCGDIIMLRANDSDTTDSELVYGLFVSCEENTSTAGDREKLLRAMKDCATAYQTASAAAAAAPAGRQISLTELFQGEGRREAQYVPQVQQGYYMPGWEGMGGQPLSAPLQQQMYYGQPQVGNSGGDMLMNLFHRASEARLRGGTPTQSQGY